MIRVIVIDDHALVRQGFVRLINAAEGMTVCAEAASGEEGYVHFKSHQPDVVICDLSMPGISAMKFLEKALAWQNDAKVIVCSMHDAPHLVNTALQHGAKGFVSKSCDPQQILQAIEAVMCGQVYVSENLVSSWPDDAVDEEKKRIEHLTSTEFEVFKMLAEGKSTQECAGILNLSEKTILNCQTAVRKKLHVNTPAGLVHFAIRNGVIAQP